MFFQKMLNKDATYQSGLTMIEMAIVLTIIGLIASTLIPSVVSTIKRGKVTETRAIMYSVRDEVLGYAVHKERLPLDRSQFGYPADAWNGEVGYHVDTGFENVDFCNSTLTSNTKVVTQHNDTVSQVAFVLYSDGPDHHQDIVISGDTFNATNQNDDLILYVTKYHLWGAACGSLD